MVTVLPFWESIVNPAGEVKSVATEVDRVVGAWHNRNRAAIACNPFPEGSNSTTRRGCIESIAIHVDAGPASWIRASNAKLQVEEFLRIGVDERVAEIEDIGARLGGSWFGRITENVDRVGEGTQHGRRREAARFQRVQGHAKYLKFVISVECIGRKLPARPGCICNDRINRCRRDRLAHLEIIKNNRAGYWVVILVRNGRRNDDVGGKLST